MRRNPGGRPRRGQPLDVDVDVGFGGEDEIIVTGDRGVYFSDDGRRREEVLLNIAHKKQKLDPKLLEDRFAKWIPVSEFDAENQEDVPDVPAGQKRKYYESSDDPMKTWRPHMQDFLDGLLWHDGLGEHVDDEHFCCALCDAEFIPPTPGEEEIPHEPNRVRLFKCCLCGEYLQCKSCCLHVHEYTPLHVLEEWTGEFWDNITLKDLGYIYQLGHGGGPCLFPDELIRKMTILAHPYIHEIHFRYCNCKKSDHLDSVQQLLRNRWYPATVDLPGTCATFTTLETFRLQNVVGNMNVHDFIGAMERQTNSTGSCGLKKVPRRYKEFMRMSRQWAWLFRMKRAGRGHDPAGVGTTKLGEGAMICWACPYDTRNLPLNWRDVDPRYKFLYMLILALDANFKLKSRVRANAHDDPSLGPGSEYFVEPIAYREHLRNYVPEKDISSCIAFAALLQKDTRATAGLRCTGVGGCVCARHECVRPNGIGDLQKGERYVNMDWILFNALVGFCLLWLTVSYDIACQWRKNLESRMQKLPAPLRLPLGDIELQCALPVWHAASHEEECQNANSLSFKPGVGKSDGEGVERTWSILNPASYHTKDMNYGNREDTLNDKINNHNYLKNMGQGAALEAKLIIALAERERQVSTFVQVNETLEKDLRRTWAKMVDAWLADPTQVNPYVVDRGDTPSEVQVRLDLKKDEEAEAFATGTPMHGTSATAFLTAGMQLEEAQRRIIAELNGRVLVAPEQESRIQDRRMALLVKLAKFRKLQRIFMPGATQILADEESARESDSPAPKAETIKIWMPHEMEEGDRATGCVRGLVNMEHKLRMSQCLNALIVLRSRLHAKRHFIAYRNANLTGQVQASRANILIALLGERVQAMVLKYRKGYEALKRLEGDGIDGQLRELKDADVTLDGDRGESASDVESGKKLATIGTGPSARVPRNAPGTTRRVMSWIWTAQGGAVDGEEHLHDSVRVEWCRALARKTRWEEEVLLVREEMRRVLRYLDWQVKWWLERVVPRPDAKREVQAGIKAYALKQAAIHRRIGTYFEDKWKQPAKQVARKVMAGPPDAALEGAALDEFFQQ
ncbi:hypothetical protein C8R43DRAFT_1126455 [Mycena crocata]|nr:hypothetical protein C8R43DRAFT_1126455 [Mycena crocata]